MALVPNATGKAGSARNTGPGVPALSPTLGIVIAASGSEAEENLQRPLEKRHILLGHPSQRLKPHLYCSSFNCAGPLGQKVQVQKNKLKLEIEGTLV